MVFYNKGSSYLLCRYKNVLSSQLINRKREIPVCNICMQLDPTTCKCVDGFEPNEEWLGLVFQWNVDRRGSVHRMTILFLLVFPLITITTCYTYQTSWNPDYDGYQQVLPQEIMVDVINNLGLHLLAIHNDNNDNNIALSPYGAASVLVALREGVRGEAVREIQNAAHIPRDISITRVGLRDIHRHLKSYFIPKEGFLAGLTLSHDNVTLHPEYEKILHFYGYDIESFNNALYPDPETTVKPASGGDVTDLTNKEMGATEETTTVTDRIVNEDVTLEAKTEEVTTEKLTTERTTPETTTITTTTTTTGKTDTTKTTQKTTERTTPETTTTGKTETTKTTTVTTTTIKTTPKVTKKSTTSQTTPTTTTRNPTTTPKYFATTFENRENPTTAKTQTTSKTPKTEPTTLTSTLFTSQKLEDSTKSNTTTVSTTPESIATSESTESTESTITPEKEISTMETTPYSTTPSMTTNTQSDEPTVKIVSRSSSPLEDLPDTKLIEETHQFESRRLTTTTFGYEYLNTEPNIEKSWLDVDGENETLKESSRRDIRSVVDYVVARYYDSQNTPKETYHPREELTFLVNGKYREGNINFMSYDTVLPFYYISHLNALALSFPLDSTKYYLLLILPVDENGVDKLVCDLKKSTNLKHIIRSLKYTHIKAVIPSFMLKGYVILTPTLQKLGIRSIFEPRHADFSPMTQEKDIYVTNIEQAITVTIRNYVDPNSIQNHRNLYQYGPVEFKADHPFLYFVIDSEIHVTLMAGKIINPLNSRIR